MATRVIDSLIVFRILKMLTTPFKKMKAYKFGFIDERGNRIKKIKDDDGKEIDNNPITTDEKNSLTPLHRLVFNLKKIIEKLIAYEAEKDKIKSSTNYPADQVADFMADDNTVVKEIIGLAGQLIQEQDNPMVDEVEFLKSIDELIYLLTHYQINYDDDDWVPDDDFEEKTFLKLKAA